MDDPSRSGSGRDRRLILAVILALAVVIGGIVYTFSDDLTELAQSLTTGKLGRAQGKLRY
jgi:hypothetical protein